MNKEEMQELEKGSGMMNKISFIIEFDEVSKIQDEQLTEFIEKTGIKFKVLESDNDLKKYKKYKEVIDRLNFIKNRKNQGTSQENINKIAIEFVNNYLKEVSE